MNIIKINDKYATVNNKLLRMVNLPSANLLADIVVLDGQVINIITGKTLKNFTADGSVFYGDGATNIIKGASLGSYTVVMLFENSYHTGYRALFTANNKTPVRHSFGLTSYSYADTDTSFSPLGQFGAKEYYIPSLTERLLTTDSNYFLGISKDAENLTVRTRQNEQGWEKVYDTEIDPVTILKLDSGMPFKRFIVYDSALSSDDLEQLYNIRGEINELWYYPATYYQGISTLGCPNAIKAQTHKIPVWNDGEVEYTAIAQENPTVEEDMSGYTDLFFINPIDTLEVGKKYNIEAHPYPYDLTTMSFNVDYSTSDSDIIECYKGFLIAKKAGTATITAVISNTEITASIEINVIEPTQIEENFYTPLLKNIQSDDAEQTLKNICEIISTAKERGHNGIKFPKAIYHIKPYQKETHCSVPTNFIIDWNYSAIYIDDNDYCHCEAGAVSKADGYNLFKFGEGTWEDYYGSPCENSIIRNGYVYGERYFNTTYAEDEYTEFTTFVIFGCRSVGCKLENMYFDSVCGFHIATQTNGYNYWSGTTLDGGTRGCTRATDYVEGRIAEDGETITDESGWYYTSDFIKIGYIYGEGDYRSIIKYKVGQMGYITYGTTGRWYDIFFYDADYNLIQKGIHQFGLETYNFPKDAVYMKVNIMNSSTPTDNTSTDVPAVVRLHPSVDPDLFEITDCTFINPHASAISITGGTRSIIENCYAQQGARYGWSIDYEDGWIGQRHHIMYKVLCSGMITFPSAHNVAVVNVFAETLQALSDTEGLRIINSVFTDALRLKAKTNDVVECCTYMPYNKGFLCTYDGVSTIRAINNTELSY